MTAVNQRSLPRQGPECGIRSVCSQDLQHLGAAWTETIHEQCSCSQGSCLELEMQALEFTC